MNGIVAVLGDTAASKPTDVVVASKLELLPLFDGQGNETRTSCGLGGVVAVLGFSSLFLQSRMAFWRKVLLLLAHHFIFLANLSARKSKS